MANRLVWTVILLLPLFRQAAARQADEQNFRISGTVVDALSGVPIARAEVSISATDRAGTETNVLTELDGGFHFEHLTPGKFVLSARHRGYLQQNFQQHENYTTGVAVGMGLASENLVFRLFLDASIAGKVTDEFTEPVRNAQVMLFREGISDGKRSVRIRAQMSTDDQGCYRFRGLESDHYYVAVAAEPWYAQHVTVQQSGNFTGPTPLVSGTIIFGRLTSVVEQNSNLDVVYPVTYYPNETNPARAGAITLQPGEVAIADFALRPVPALHLKLTAPMEDLSEGVGVQVSRRTLGGYEVLLPGVQTTNNKDFIEIDGISPGPVDIGLDGPVAPGANERGRRWQQETEASRDTEISLAENDGVANISGIVKATGPAVFPQGQSYGIEIRNSETGVALYSAVSAEGKFSFENAALKPGKYDVTVVNAPGFYVNHVQAAGSKVSGRSFEFRSFEPVRLTVEISEGLGRVEGVAVQDAKAIGGVMILLVPQNFREEPSLFKRDQSDSDGTFALSDVPPGRYTVIAVANGWDQEWANQDVLKSWLSDGQVVDVAPNGKYSIKVNVQRVDTRMPGKNGGGGGSCTTAVH